MSQIESEVSEVLRGLNWLMEPHDSHAELIEVKENKVIIRCVGHCAECETDCVRIAFKERMPGIELIIQ